MAEVQNGDNTKWERVKKFIYKNTLWLLGFLSILLYGLSYISSNEWIKVVSMNGGTAVLGSGVFAATIKAFQFLGLFREELREVLISHEFLKSRNDLPKLWKDVSRAIFNEKFPKVTDSILNDVLDHYFPTDHDYYYSDVLVKIDISELTDDMFIKYSEKYEFTVVMHNARKDSSIEYACHISDDDERTINLMETIKVNGEKKTISCSEDNRTYKIDLKGKGEYKVIVECKREYSIAKSNYKIISMMPIVLGMEVDVKYPDNVFVSFFEVGLVHDFIHKHEPSAGRVCLTHKEGVILPYQGFGLSFQKLAVGK